LPVLPGLDVQSRMRAAHLRIPVVFVTASDGVAFDLSAARGGAVRLFRKAFSSLDLLEAVARALGNGSPGT
jgi:FixJ family two-component response regulator